MRSLIKKSWYTIRRLHPKKKDLRHANNQEKKKRLLSPNETHSDLQRES
jgi:hypothetical protein